MHSDTPLRTDSEGRFFRSSREAEKQPALFLCKKFGRDVAKAITTVTTITTTITTMIVFFVLVFALVFCLFLLPSLTKVSRKSSERTRMEMLMEENDASSRLQLQ